eukprot:3325769-Rhodomonas_salina.1
MAFTDVVGLNVTIGDKAIQDVTGTAIGQCLPERTATDVTSIRGVGMMRAVGIVAGELMETATHAISNLALASISTAGDAAIAWMVGV